MISQVLVNMYRDMTLDTDVGQISTESKAL